MGGTAGTFFRALLTELDSSVPEIWAIWLVNMLGAFGLGFLYEALARRAVRSTTREQMRLLFGTGFFGGFTTYSALALLTATTTLSGQLPLALAYGLATVVFGAVATMLGILLGMRFGPDAAAEPSVQGE